MPTALNLTLPLKQDAESQRRLAAFVAEFPERIQGPMEQALARSERVHFARVLVLDNRWLQVLTEFDKDPLSYTEFFRIELRDIFREVLALVENAPPWDEIDNEVRFYEYMLANNPPSLGVRAREDYNRGYVYQAFPDLSVDEINDLMAANSPP
jgi:hypothetical protein